MKVKPAVFFFSVTCSVLILLCGISPVYSQSGGVGVKTIVIDPGHGGKDPGTVWGQAREKDINLSVALKLGEMIEKNLPDVKVVYTRKTDVFIPLAQRGEIANKAGGDLFLSIHVNAVDAGKTAPSGAITFVMGTKNAEANLDIAMRENDVITYEDDYNTKYEGYVPGSPESFILFSLMQYVNMDQSMQFASIVQKHYKSSTPIPDLGVRQAGFLVLWRTSMPAVLTELGFLPNEKDRRTLTSESGQKSLATALFNSVSEYKSRVEGRTNIVQLGTDDGSVAADPQQTGGGTQNTSVAENSDGSGIVYRIQICSTPSKLPKNSAAFKEYRGRTTEIKTGNLYKYYVGECSTYAEALEKQAEVRKCIPDAFMTAFRGTELLSVAEARRLTD